MTTRRADIQRIIGNIQPQRIAETLKRQIARDPAGLRDALLRADIDFALLRRLVIHDRQALDALDEVLQFPPHLHRGSSRSPKAPTGNSVEAALRRLRADPRPFVRTLRAKVLSGEMTVHRAAIEAGYRAQPARRRRRTTSPRSEGELR